MTLVQKGEGVWEGDECLVCHRRPAHRTKVQSLSSFLIFYFVRTLIAPLCRDHAVELTRQHLRRTLMLGWWGVGLAGMPIWIPVIMRRLTKAKKIPPPEGTAPPEGTERAPDAASPTQSPY